MKRLMRRIYWESKLTGIKDHGTTKFSYEVACELCQDMNREYVNELIHWGVEI